MKVVFSRAFKKDVLKPKDVSLKRKLKKTIIQLETEPTLKTMVNCTKMKGHPSAHRIRIGNYGLGLYLKKDTVELARFVKRNDIYKLFP